MRQAINYTICTTALFVVVALICSDSLVGIAIGLLWSGVLYLSGKKYPKFWKRYWMSNMRIMSYFHSL